MKLRYGLIIYTVAFIVMMVSGFYLRQSFTNKNEEKNPLNAYNVSILNENFSDQQIELMTKTLKDQPIIISVTCESDFDFLYRCAVQHVKIDKVFKGENLKVGDEISVLMSNSIFDKSEDIEIQAINTGFISPMKKNEKYLIFLSRKVDAPEKIYLFADEFMMSPVFSYAPITLTPMESEITPGMFIKYENTKSNSFYFNKQTSIDKLLKLRETLLEKYSM